MKFVFVSDSFKGSLSSRETAELLEKAAREVFGGSTEKLTFVSGPVADGGEGTVEAVLESCHGSRRTVLVHGPLMEETEACYGIVDSSFNKKISKEKQSENGPVAIIEMAAASGYALVPVEKKDPGKASSYGTGELMADAMAQGCRKICIAIGGSATNDGGMGAMQALGVRFLDAAGKELAGCGENLIKVARVDDTGLLPQLVETEIIVMCDVTNPLTGAAGATRMFGPQKGATPDMVERLETGMEHYRSCLQNTYGVDVNTIPGAGAAGGLGAALAVFCHGRMEPGIETVLDLIGFDGWLDDADLVVSGEGCTDGQSLHGKVPCGVALRCKKRGIPLVLLSGGMKEGAEELYQMGVDSIMVTPSGPMNLQEALADAPRLYYNAARRMFRLIQTGMKLKTDADGIRL